MIKVMMVCHGNICRSTMAEFVLKDLVKKQGKVNSFYIASSATSTDALGMGIDSRTIAKLEQNGIYYNARSSVQLQKSDYEIYDYIIGMDSYNLINIRKIFGGDVSHKTYKLLDFTDTPRDIDDPWYTHDFDKTYDDIQKGCTAFLKFLKAQQNK